ncbi:hypothetical protein CsSME_00040389 [Camellia sinensis var. sinensis]
MMENNLEASNNNAIVGDEDNELEELKKQHESAALILSNMKFLELDNQTAANLRIMKKKFIGSFGADLDGENMTQSQESSYIMDHEHGVAIDGLTLPRLPPVKELEGLIGICSVPFEKQLTESDVKDNLSRISIPKSIIEKFLKPLMNSKEDLVSGISVTTYDSKGNEYPMKFKTWASKIHVLTEGWKGFCHANKLKAHQDWVTIWMFRHIKTEKLCFIVMARRFPIYQSIIKRSSKKG